MKGDLYRQLGKSTLDVIGYRNKAGIESIERASDQAYRQKKQEQTTNNFGAISGLIGVGASLYGNFKKNQELSQFAQSKGFEDNSNNFSKIFGSPSFYKDGQKFDQSFMYGLQEYDSFKTQKNLMNDLDFIEKGGF